MRTRDEGVDNTISFAVHCPPHLLLKLPLLDDELCLELLHVLPNRCLNVHLELLLQLLEFIHDTLPTPPLGTGQPCPRNSALEDLSQQALVPHHRLRSSMQINKPSQLAFLW